MNNQNALHSALVATRGNASFKLNHRTFRYNGEPLTDDQLQSLARKGFHLEKQFSMKPEQIYLVGESGSAEPRTIVRGNRDTFRKAASMGGRR